MKYFLLALLGLGVALAGTNNLPVIAPGVIQLVHINKFQTALSGAFVPRNSLGNVTDIGASVGTSLYRWANVYSQTTTLQTGATDYPVTFSVPLGNTIAEPIQWLTQLPFDPTGGYHGIGVDLNNYKTNMVIDSDGGMSLGALSGPESVIVNSDSLNARGQYGRWITDGGYIPITPVGTYTTTSATASVIANDGILAITQDTTRGRDFIIETSGNLGNANSIDVPGGNTATISLTLTVGNTYSCTAPTLTLAKYEFKGALHIPFKIHEIIRAYQNQGVSTYALCASIDSGGTLTVKNVYMLTKEL